MGGHINGETTAMENFAQLGIPELGGDLTRAAPEACPSPYGVSMEKCPPLIAADKMSTERLQRFLTHMTQGLTAYSAVALECSRIYADGDDKATRGLEVIRRPPGGLPEIAPELRPGGR
ncbi:hypothetical protein [Actinokineospora sp. HUAS TT18]|uniref:hypothetical protein n=1 Tax=Actinokineospora sp. HUAS TT18 TaxID=3447451 RepID=UPI003F51E11D